MLCEIPEVARRMLALFQREILTEQIRVPRGAWLVVAEQVGAAEEETR